MRGRPGADTGRDGVDRLGVVEIAQAEVDAALDRMHVAVLEARQHHAAGQVDHLGAGPIRPGGRLSVPT